MYFPSSLKALLIERKLARFDENRKTVGMLNPLRDKNEGFFIPGDRRGDTCYIPRRVQKGPEGKT